MLATRNKILACIIDPGSIGAPEGADGCTDRKTISMRQITAMTKQAIPSQ